VDQLPAVIEPAIRRLRELEPGAIAVLVGGSYATGTADELSDLDLTALVDRDGGRYRTWFQECPGRRPLHVSAGVKTVAERLARQEEPNDWWLGLPMLDPARYAWATDAAREQLGEDPSIRRPAGPPELEDFFEFSMKVRRAIEAGDSLGLRVYAMAAAELAPRLLLPLNNSVFVSSRREAAETALAFAVAPEHYAEDLRVCLGLVPTDDATLGAAAPRLARELLAFLRERKPDVDPIPDLVRTLTDGSLERQLAP
jgi:Nucleotidyltransferase domain